MASVRITNYQHIHVTHIFILSKSRLEFTGLVTCGAGLVQVPLAPTSGVWPGKAVKHGQVLRPLHLMESVKGLLASHPLTKCCCGHLGLEPAGRKSVSPVSPSLCDCFPNKKNK